MLGAPAGSPLSALLVVSPNQAQLILMSSSPRMVILRIAFCFKAATNAQQRVSVNSEGAVQVQERASLLG